MKAKPKEYTVAQWAEKRGVKRSAIYMQIERGNLKGATYRKYLGRTIITPKTTTP